jgi:hypothetical protein
VSLVDDTGVDDVMLSLSRLMMKDLNLSVSSVVTASEASMQWSRERNNTSISSGSATKTFRVLLLVLNSSVYSKFDQALDGSIFEGEQTGSVDATEEVLADTNSDGLPIFAIGGAPTMSDGQQTAMKALAAKYSLPCIITVPRTLLDELEQCKK